MPEEVVDSVVLHEPRHEIEIGLTVLDAIRPLRISLGQSQLVIAKAETFEDVFDDFRSRFVLDNPAIGATREQPEPGHHLRGVVAKIKVPAGLPETADHTIDKPITASQ